MDQVFQFQRDIDVMDDAFGSFFQGHWGEVQDTADSQTDQRFHHIGGDGFRDGEDCEPDVLGGDYVGQLADMEDGNRGMGVEFCGVAVETGHDADSLAGEPRVVQQGGTDFSAADDDDVLGFFAAEEAVDLGEEVVHAVAAAFMSGQAEVGEVFSDQWG